MKLSLSSEAARDLSSRELLAGCVRRGLVGLELYESDVANGDDGGLELGPSELSGVARRLGVEVCGLYRRRLPAEAIAETARMSAALSAPTVVPIGGLDRSILPRTVEVFKEAGARLALAHGTDARVVEAIRWLIEPIPHSEVVCLAWEIRPGIDDPHRMPDVLEAAGDALRYVRLYGGGPEAHAQAGLGIGTVMARLTLARYSGPLVLTPSDLRYHQVWNAWLGRGGGWGCGSKQSDSSTVALGSAPRALELR